MEEGELPGERPNGKWGPPSLPYNVTGLSLASVSGELITLACHGAPLRDGFGLYSLLATCNFTRSQLVTAPLYLS